MIKRSLSFVLALVLGFLLAVPAVATETGYSDVPEDHWAAEHVRRATEAGLFQGIGDGQFGIGQPISRAAFVTALVRLFGWPAVIPEKDSYTDVTADKWYYTPVETARAKGALVTLGNTFRPTEDITREEMAAMLVRALGYASIAGKRSGAPSPFTDVTTNRGFITLAYELGIVSGMGDNIYDPAGTATREQAAAVLVRVCDKLRADMKKVEEVGDDISLAVSAPEPKKGQQVPTTPLEPLAELYDALYQLKKQGQDMSRVVLCLTGGGICTITAGGGQILQTEELTAAEVAEILEENGDRLYYSDRYESAYCIYQANGYQTATLWYQNEESLAVKLQLARLLGVQKYMLVEPVRETVEE